VARVEDCPRSSAIGLAEIVGNDRAAFTAMLTGPDAMVTDELELSVTWSSNDQDPTLVNIPEDIDTGDVQGEELPKLE